MMDLIMIVLGLVLCGIIIGYPIGYLRGKFVAVREMDEIDNAGEVSANLPPIHTSARCQFKDDILESEFIEEVKR